MKPTLICSARAMLTPSYFSRIYLWPSISAYVTTW